MNIIKVLNLKIYMDIISSKFHDSVPSIINCVVYSLYPVFMVFFSITVDTN